MPYVITIDQRSSRRGEDRVDAWVEELNAEFAPALELPFAAAVGDELQGLAREPAVAVELVLRGIRFGWWWVGVGIGAVEHPLRESATRSRGPAFYRARTAVEAAKRRREGFAVAARDPEDARAVEAALGLLAFVLRRRGASDSKRWQAVDLARGDRPLEEIGRALGVSKQAAWSRLRAAGWDEEREGRWLAERELRRADGQEAA